MLATSSAHECALPPSYGPSDPRVVLSDIRPRSPVAALLLGSYHRLLTGEECSMGMGQGARRSIRDVAHRCELVRNMLRASPRSIQVAALVSAPVPASTPWLLLPRLPLRLHLCLLRLNPLSSRPCHCLIRRQTNGRAPGVHFRMTAQQVTAVYAALNARLPQHQSRPSYRPQRWRAHIHAEYVPIIAVHL